LQKELTCPHEVVELTVTESTAIKRQGLMVELHFKNLKFGTLEKRNVTENWTMTMMR
jgi:hypothetical protein